MAKKRKSAGLEEVDRTFYSAFYTVANSLSQLYTHATNHQKVSFQAGERHAPILPLDHDLVKQEPRDYRPYLFQGIIYTLLRKKKEADEQLDKYKRLVPKEHPYANYFDHNVKNTAKAFSEAVEK